MVFFNSKKGKKASVRPPKDYGHHITVATNRTLNAFVVSVALRGGVDAPTPTSSQPLSGTPLG
ncbi:hypothetical protein ACFLY8_02315 [Halobacteriota archaeon]